MKIVNTGLKVKLLLKIMLTSGNDKWQKGEHQNLAYTVYCI